MIILSGCCTGVNAVEMNLGTINISRDLNTVSDDINTKLNQEELDFLLVQDVHNSRRVLKSKSTKQMFDGYKVYSFAKTRQVLKENYVKSTIKKIQKIHIIKQHRI